MSKLLTMLVLFTSLAISPVEARADLLISEVLFNEIGSNTAGEWIEIFNNGTTSLDLTGFKIGDEETSGATSNTEGMFLFPTGALIGSGEAQVIAVDADVFFTNYGRLPTYEVTGSNASIPNLSVYAAWDPDTSAANTINMSNANDQLALLDTNDVIVDAVNWGNNFFMDPGLNPDAEGDGQSWEIISGLVDNNSPGDWQLGSNSSPFVVAVPEPTSLSLATVFCTVAMLGYRRRRKTVSHKSPL